MDKENTKDMYMEKLIGEALLVMVRNGLTTEDYEFEGNCLYLNFEPLWMRPTTFMTAPWSGSSSTP